MKNGTLFDILENGALEAKYTRFLFKQALSAIEYLHKLGYSHRDIKLDNILVGSDYDLKLADFGLASKSKKSSTVKGTLYYMAPEVVAEKEYNTNDSDLYALAVVLFSMLTHSMPFNVASKKCPLYRKIMADDWASFWKTHSSSKLIDNDFKDLFAKMVDPNPELRLSISEILDHPWMKGEIATKEEVVKHLKTRIPSEVNLTKAQNKEESTNMAERTGYFNIRSAGKLMKYLEEFAKNEKLNYKTCPNYYRMIAEIGKKPNDLVLQMNILKRHESYQRCVELILINGNKKDFLSFKSKIEEFIACRQNN